MLLERLGSAWEAVQSDLKREVRVLVVDDEAIVRQVLCDVVELSGYEPTAVEDAEQAIAVLREGNFDLLVTDKNLPGSDGVDLIAQARSEGMRLPAVLVTAYPSLATISRALKVGAADYLTKPFDDILQVQKRLETVVEAEHTGKLMGRIVSDLQRVISEQGVDTEIVRDVARELFAFKRALAGRPDALVVSPARREAQLTRLFLEGMDLRVGVCETAAEALDRLGGESAPFCVLLSLDIPGALDEIPRLLAVDPGLEILVSAARGQLDQGVKAISLGASDLLLGSEEGLDLLGARVKRAATRARRGRLYLHLMATLVRRANALGGEAAKAVAAVIPSAHRDALDSGPAPTVTPEDLGELEIDLDLEEIFEQEEGEPVDPYALEIEVGPMEATAESPDLAEASSGTGPKTRGGQPLAMSPEGWPGLPGPTPAVPAGRINLEDAAVPSAMASARLGRRVELARAKARNTASVSVSLQDLFALDVVVGEWLSFFMDPHRYQDSKALEVFLGSAEGGGLAELGRWRREALRKPMQTHQEREDSD